MKEFSRISHYTPVSIAAVALCALLPGGCLSPPPPSPTVTRVILMWLKHPERKADRAKLIRAAHSLRMIHGVERVEAGGAIPTLAPGADRSFDLGVVITFRDRAALVRYEKDPRHLEAMRRYLRPLVRRYEVYNLGGR
ncbi:MAG: Dabb family protein [Spartobacteria bacterium]